MKAARVPIHLLVPDPDQPRKRFDPGELTALSENIKTIGQQVPLICWQADGKVYIADGERRWRGGKLAELTDMLAIVLPERPSQVQLRIIQNSLDVHRAQYTLMERSTLVAEIQKETGWGPTELASELSMQQSTVSKLLAYQKLAPEVQALLHTGALDGEKAYLISQIDDHATQVAMVKEAAHLSRESLRGKIKNNGHTQPKAKRAVFTLPDGMSVTFNGREADLPEIVEGLVALVKELRKGISQGLTVDSAQRVLRDKAKV